MSIYILLVMLFVLLFASYIIFNNDVFSPPCLFCIAFILSVSNLILNLRYWDVNFKLNTTIVILLGVSSFVFGAKIFSKFRTAKQRTATPISNIEAKRLPLLIWFFFECIILLMVINYLINYTGANLFTAITLFRQASFTDNPIRYPFWLSQCYFVCRRSAYIWAYIIVNNYFLNKKIDVIILMCFLISAIYPFFAGERGSIVELLLGIFLLIVLHYQYMLGKRKKLKFRSIIMIVLAGSLAAYVFTLVGTFIGREVLSMGETISIYLGAPVLNLNTWLQRSYASLRLWDNRTLSGVIDFIRMFGAHSIKGGETGFIYRLANGHVVGNVYTTFATFYFDHGMIGVVLFSFLMGGITQSLYMRCACGFGKSPFRFILLMYLYPLVFFSFFSNRFFVVFDEIFIRSLIVWWILIEIFIRKRFRFKVKLFRTI